MRILHITPSYKPAFVYGGPIYSVSTLCEAQVLAGNEVTVFTTDANGIKNLDVTLGINHSIEGVNVIYHKRLSGDHTHISPALWFKILRDVKHYDIVHLHSWWSILMVVSAWILSMKRIRFIISPRGMFSNYSFQHNRNPLKKGFLFEWVTKKVLKKQVFHCTAPSEAIEIKALFGHDVKYFTLPNLLKFPNITTQERNRQNNKDLLDLLFISRIDKKKGIELLLRSFKLIIDSGVIAELNIVGTGDKNYISSLVHLTKELKIDHYINWKGNVEWRKKFYDIINSDLLILPSHNENFANVILETLYVGRPVIVSKHVGLSDYVNENNFGWVVELNEVQIAESIMDYVNRKNKWLSRQESIHEQILLDFDSKKLCNSYINYYKTV